MTHNQPTNSALYRATGFYIALLTANGAVWALNSHNVVAAWVFAALVLINVFQHITTAHSRSHWVAFARARSAVLCTPLAMVPLFSSMAFNCLWVIASRGMAPDNFQLWLNITSVGFAAWLAALVLSYAPFKFPGKEFLRPAPTWQLIGVGLAVTPFLFTPVTATNDMASMANLMATGHVLTALQTTNTGMDILAMIAGACMVVAFCNVLGIAALVAEPGAHPRQWNFWRRLARTDALFFAVGDLLYFIAGENFAAGLIVFGLLMTNAYGLARNQQKINTAVPVAAWREFFSRDSTTKLILACSMASCIYFSFNAYAASGNAIKLNYALGYLILAVGYGLWALRLRLEEKAQKQ